MNDGVVFHPPPPEPPPRRVTRLVEEDWSRFNAAVLRRLDGAPTPVEAAEIQFRRRIGVALLAVGLGLAAWLGATAVQRLRAPATAELDASRLALPPLRIHPDDLARLAGGSGAAGAQVPAALRDAIGGTSDQGAAGAAGTAGGERVVTNFTIFHSVRHAGGTVSTGWSYASSADRAPAAQFCYFMRDVRDDASIRLNLAEADRGSVGYNLYDADNDGVLSRAEFEAAQAKCVWTADTRGAR